MAVLWNAASGEKKGGDQHDDDVTWTMCLAYSACFFLADISPSCLLLLYLHPCHLFLAKGLINTVSGLIVLISIKDRSEGICILLVST